MEKEIITGKQAINIMSLYLLATSLIISGTSEAKHDSWISMIFAVIMVLPFVFVYARLSKLYPQKDIFDIAFEVFGKIGGGIITIVLIFYVLQLGALVIRNFSEFIQVASLPETPQFITAILMGIVCFWALKHGMEMIGRGTVLIFPIIIIVIILTIILSIKDMEIGYIKPIFGQGFKKIFSGAISLFAFPFAETFLFISVMPCLKPKESPYKIYYTSLFTGGIIFLFTIIRNILVFGPPNTEALYFPSYSTASIINIGDFITRIEVLVAGNFILSGVAKVFICLYVASKGICKLFKIDNYKLLLAPITFFTVAFSGLMYTNTMQMFEFINVYKYYALIFEILIPVIIFIFAEVKTRKAKKAN